MGQGKKGYQGLGLLSPLLLFILGVIGGQKLEAVENQLPQARVKISTNRLLGPPVSRLLFGKFTEHLGRNVYGGAWAEAVENPWFVALDRWGNPQAIRHRLQEAETLHHLPGLAQAPERGISAWWTVEGEARCSLEPGIRGTSQRITAPTAGVSLQTPLFLPLHRQERYRFILRGRASQKVFLTLRLYTSERRLLSQEAITFQPGDWQTIRGILRVSAHKMVPRGTPLVLALHFDSPGTLWLDRCSLVPTDAKYGWDPEVVEAMRRVRLPLLRFPGGNFASGYHWKDGVGPLDQRPILPNPAWPDVMEWGEVGTDEWLKLCELVGCEPLICINAGDGTPEEAAQWVEYCNGPPDTPMGALRSANGHPEPYRVRFWEVGNELYGSWQIGHTTAEGYAQRYLQFRSAMLAVDPSLLLIANGYDPSWNRTLIRIAGDRVRSLSVHTLQGSHIRGEVDPKEVFLEAMGYTYAYSDLLKELAEPMREAGLPPKLAITELSIFIFPHHLPNMVNLSEALFYSGIINSVLRSQGLVELVTHSALINHLGGLAKWRGVVYPHPVWLALYLYSTQPGVQPVQTEVEAPTFNTSGKWLRRVEKVPYLDVASLVSEGGEILTVFVTNRDPDKEMDTEILLEDFPCRERVYLDVLTGDSFLSENTWENPEAVQIRSLRLRTEGSLLRWKFPAHSLTRITFFRK